MARAVWLEKRESELLPVPYFHVVFTLPHELGPLALQNKRVVYGILFRAAAQTLLEIAADPKHLGAKIGCLMVLHTWGQNLMHHPHVHAIVTGGGLSADGSRWIHGKQQQRPQAVLRAWESSQPCLPGKVHRRFETSVSKWQTRIPWSPEVTRQRSRVRATAEQGRSSRLGRLRQTPVLFTRLCAEVSGPLHASRRHLEPASGRAAGWPSEFSLQGLRDDQQSKSCPSPAVSSSAAS